MEDKSTVTMLSFLSGRTAISVLISHPRNLVVVVVMWPARGCLRLSRVSHA